MNNKGREETAVNGENGTKSVIINTLDKWAGGIYSLLCGGFLGRMFTSYSAGAGKIAGKLTSKNKVRGGLDKARRSVARTLEQSAAASLYARFVSCLMAMKTKVYGTFTVTFFMYAAAVSLFRYFTGGEGGVPVDTVRFVLLALAGIPLLMTDKSLRATLALSGIGRHLLVLTGSGDRDDAPPAGRCSIAFLAGTLMGIVTLFIPADTIVKLLFRAVWAMAVFHSTEFGVVSLFFLMPFDATMTLVAEVGVVLASFALKLILGKRTVKLEAVDIAGLMFGVMVFAGGVFSISASSLKPMLVYLCFMSAYFLTVCLMRSAEWLERCLRSAVIAAVIVAAYGVIQYMTGAIGFSTQWLDAEMFEGISGRAFSTLENPNVLGEYLVMTIPMAAVLFLCRYDSSKKRFAAFCGFGCMCLCLVVTWSRGAWLGIMLAALVFCLIWNKRILHMFWVALLAVPLLPTILPDNVLARITSIGNVADSSTAYRLNIWLGTVKMLPDRILSGIGIGNGAWRLVYPHYALTGMNEAQHSHSLYFQIWVEMGAIALVIFVGFILLLFMSNFTMYKGLSEVEDSLMARVAASPVKTETEKTESDTYRRFADRFFKAGVSAGKDSAASKGSVQKKNAARSRVAMRMNAAAPLCGVAGVLLQGFTDNIWYNYRVFLMFWLCLGLCSAYASYGRERLNNAKQIYTTDATKASIDVDVTPSASPDTGDEPSDSVNTDDKIDSEKEGAPE